MFRGDPHGKFGHIVELGSRLRQQEVILPGGMEPPRAPQDETASLSRAGVPWYFIAGSLALRGRHEERSANYADASAQMARERPAGRAPALTIGLGTR